VNGGCEHTRPARHDANATTRWLWAPSFAGTMAVTLRQASVQPEIEGRAEETVRCC
jgi:hypothetical protein